MKATVTLYRRDKDGNATKIVERSAVADFPIGESLEQAIKIHGAEAVFSAYTDGAIVKMQSAARRLMGAKDDKGGTVHADKALPKLFADLKLSALVRAPADPEKKKAQMVKGLQSLTKAQLAEVLKQAGLE